MAATHDPTALLLAGQFACPRCDNGILEAVTDGEETNFLCHRCWTCWHVELGYMSPVPVSTCPGCPYRPECLQRRGEPADGGADKVRPPDQSPTA
jgi:hypothetical protein